jgi:hypothetical protein
LGMGQTAASPQVMFPKFSHWLITKASLPYMNQDKYLSQTNHSGTDLKFFLNTNVNFGQPNFVHLGKTYKSVFKQDNML